MPSLLSRLATTTCNDVLRLLRENGWGENAGRPDFTAKRFATAVGPREASAWCLEGGKGSHWIHGCYYSEGRNILESHSVEIPGQADNATVAGAVQRFMEGAEAVINESYAMRLVRAA
jgi:hypothetical protein